MNKIESGTSDRNPSRYSDHTLSPVFEARWQAARNMWDQGYTKAQIAEVYEISEKALKTRIQKWRRQHGWFPPRNPPMAGASRHMTPQDIRDAAMSENLI